MPKLFVFLIVVLTACGDSPGGGLDFDRNKPVYEGEGDDPGKSASGCYPAFQDEELNVVTWNIKFFSESNTDLDKVKSIVEDLDADIIAVQEINSISSFNTLANLMTDWEGYSVDIGGSLDLGYLVKESSFTSVGSISTDFNTILRPAAVINVKHVSGLDVTLFNIHLKCCGNGYSQRVSASNSMKNTLDANYASSQIIVLGDFNDEISTSSSPFQNFISDASDYRFADMTVATGSGSNFSYACTEVSYCPSHIDHIMISNELFDAFTRVQTIKPEPCVSGYSFDVSDHRPVLASFK